MWGTTMAVQRLRLHLHTSSAAGVVFIPGQSTKIPHATQHGQTKK